MKVFNHIIVEEQIIGISPVKLEKGVFKDRLYFEIYTLGGPVKIESQWFDGATPDGPAVLKSFEADHAAAWAAVRKVTREETKDYSVHIAEVDVVYAETSTRLERVFDYVRPSCQKDALETRLIKCDLIESLNQLRNLACK